MRRLRSYHYHFWEIKGHVSRVHTHPNIDPCRLDRGRSLTSRWRLWNRLLPFGTNVIIHCLKSLCFEYSAISFIIFFSPYSSLQLTWKAQMHLPVYRIAVHVLKQYPECPNPDYVNGTPLAGCIHKLTWNVWVREYVRIQAVRHESSSKSIKRRFDMMADRKSASIGKTCTFHTASEVNIEASVFATKNSQNINKPSDVKGDMDADHTIIPFYMHGWREKRVRLRIRACPQRRVLRNPPINTFIPWM